MEQDFDWVKDDDSLNMEYFIEGGIHLSHQGNKTFATTIIRKLNDIECLLPTSSKVERDQFFSKIVVLHKFGKTGPQ